LPLACLCIRLYVCLYVCLSISSPISKTTRPNLTKFSYLLPWLGPRPTRTHYIMYYRFYISEYLNCARGRSLLSLIAFFAACVGTLIALIVVILLLSLVIVALIIYLIVSKRISKPGTSIAVIMEHASILDSWKVYCILCKASRVSAVFYRAALC